MAGEDCSWIALDTARCNYVVSESGMAAKDACPAACNVDWACEAPSTSGYVWIQESVSPTLHTSVSNARPIFAEGDMVYHDTYFVSFCADDTAADYNCVVHCKMGMNDYSMCGPGGALGKGEAFKDNVCVPMEELTVNQNCAIPWDSDEKFGAPCFDGMSPETLGTDNCTHTWQEWWDMVYDYAATTVGQQFDKGFRMSNIGNVFLPHGNANLIKLGLGISNPDTRFSSFYGEGWFSQIVEDWLPHYCNVTNNTAKIPEDLEAQFPDEFVNQFYGAGTVFSYDAICGPDKVGTNLPYSGYIDILGPVNLFTLTSSTPPTMLNGPDGPEELYASSYAADIFEPQYGPNNGAWDPFTADGQVYWPELDVSYECFFDFMPKEYCNNSPGPVVFANANPTSYKFDTPVQIDSVGLGSYDPCTVDDDPTFMGLNSSCYHFHQGGPHFRNGQMAPFYPVPKSCFNFDPSLDFIFFFLTWSVSAFEVVIILVETRKKFFFIYFYF